MPSVVDAPVQAFAPKDESELRAYADDVRQHEHLPGGLPFLVSQDQLLGATFSTFKVNPSVRRKVVEAVVSSSLVPPTRNLDYEPKLLQVVRRLNRAGGVELVASELQHMWSKIGVDSEVLTMTALPSFEPKSVHLIAPWLSRLPVRGRGKYVGLILSVPIFTFLATRRQNALSKGRVTISHGDTLAGDICIVHAVNEANLAEKKASGTQVWRLNPMHHWVSWRDRRSIGLLKFKRYVALSTRIAKELHDIYKVPKSRIVIIPNGVDIDRFTPDRSKRARIRKEFNIPEAASLLLFVGHEFKRKGLEYVVRALAKLPDNFFFLVVGSDDGAASRALARTLGIQSNRVVFAGPRSDLEAIYPAADAFVFPTAYEAFGLVCMEAMACGVPLFATRVGGIEDFLKDGENGYFIERDAESIASTLGRVLSNPAEVERLGRTARQSAERYSWADVAARYLELARSLS